MVDTIPVIDTTDIDSLSEAGGKNSTRPEAWPSLESSRQTRRVTEKSLPEMKRLVVLVPDQDVDEAEFARKIWALTSGKQVAVLFITQLANWRYEAQARRRLVTLSALSADRCCRIETRIVNDKDWGTALAPIYEDGDLIVCHEGQLDGLVHGERQQLSEALMACFVAPVFVLSGLYERITPHRSSLLFQAGYWFSFLLILAIFFGLEMGIDRISTGWVNHSLSMLAFLIEVGLIWGWNRFGK